MRTLCETELLLIEHEFELTELVEKRTGAVLATDEFYGDPSCGLISPKNEWAIMAGEHITIWQARRREKRWWGHKVKKNQITVIDDDELCWIYDMRLKTSGKVEILTDPWGEISAIWELNMDSLEYTKIKDFRDYFEKKLQGDVIW